MHLCLWAGGESGVLEFAVCGSGENTSVIWKAEKLSTRFFSHPQQSISKDIYALCHSRFGKLPAVQLISKGVNGILEAEQHREDTMNVIGGQQVHISCRRSYTDAKSLANHRKNLHSSGKSGLKRKLLSSVPESQLRIHRIFCGQERKLQGKTTSYKVICIRT